MIIDLKYVRDALRCIKLHVEFEEFDKARSQEMGLFIQFIKAIAKENVKEDSSLIAQEVLKSLDIEYNRYEEK